MLRTSLYILILSTLWVQLFAEKSTNHHETIVLDSDESIVYLEENQTLLAQVNASLSSSDVLLLADRIRWDRQLNHVHADGSVSLNYYGVRILADNLTLELDSGNYSAKNVGGVSPFFSKQKVSKETMKLWNSINPGFFNTSHHLLHLT